MKDYYAILEVAPTASLEVINNAYRALVKKYHPDRSLSASHKEKMTRMLQDINQAYQVLSHELARKQYDAEWTRYQAEHPVSEQSNGPSGMTRLKKLLFWAAVSALICLTFQMVGKVALVMVMSPLGKLCILFALIYFLARKQLRSR